MSLRIQSLLYLSLLSVPTAVWAQTSQQAAQPGSGQQTQTDSTAPPQPSTQPVPQQPGKLPDTVSAPPFTVGDKFDYRIVQTFGFRGFGGAFVSAAIGQAANSPKEWGQGVKGYAERYGSGFAGNLSRQTFAFVIESALHEDPRYFPSEDRSFKSRTANAFKQVFYCKKDDGTGSIAYGRMISAFGAGQFVNVWQPPSTDSAGEGFRRGFYTLGTDLAYNLMQEFIPFTRPVSIRHRH